MTTLSASPDKLPSYCAVCRTPLDGPWGMLFYLSGIRRSARQPGVCSRCNSHISDGSLVEITVLFADLSGFTALTNELGAERAHEIVETFLISAAAAVTTTDGVVDKFIGDAVMAIFNAPIRREDHAGRALDAAQGILAATAELSRRFSRPFSAQVGIASGWARLGRVAGGEVTAIGAPVNLAARLESEASPGEIVVDSAVFSLSRGKAEEWDHEELNLKGFPGVTSVYRRRTGAAGPRHMAGSRAGEGGSSGISVGSVVFALLGAPCAAAALLSPLVVPLGLGSLFAASSAVWLLDAPFARATTVSLAVLGAAANVYALVRARGTRRRLSPTPLEKAREAWIIVTSVMIAIAFCAETWAHARMAAMQMP
mgnify:CR=1 FL=1